MILNFQNVSDLEESWETLLPAAELLLSQQVHINSSLIGQIQTLQRILFQQVSTRKVIPPIQPVKKQTVQIGLLNKQIQTVLQENLKKIALIQQQPVAQIKQPSQKKKIIQPVSAVIKVPQRPVIPPRKYKVPAPVIKKEIPQPPQRIRQGNFAPKMRASIQSPNPNRRASRSKEERVAIPPEQTRQVQGITEKVGRQQKGSTLRRQQKVTTEKCQTKKAIQFLKPKRLNTQLKSHKQLPLLQYSREQLGYAKNQAQAKLNFLRSLNSHFYSVRRQTLPSPLYSPQAHRLSVIRFCLQKAKQERINQIQRYYACQLIQREIKELRGSEEEAAQLKGRLIRLQVQGQQIRTLSIDFALSLSNIEKRYQEFRLILIKFFVNRGLRKKTQMHNQYHLEGLKSLIQIGLRKGRSTVTFIESRMLRQFFK